MHYFFKSLAGKHRNVIYYLPLHHFAFIFASEAGCPIENINKNTCRSISNDATKLFFVRRPVDKLMNAIDRTPLALTARLASSGFDQIRRNLPAVSQSPIIFDKYPFSSIFIHIKVRVLLT
jgi:hypothetical protein